MASNLEAMASNLEAMAPNLEAMASDLEAMASNLSFQAWCEVRRLAENDAALIMPLTIWRHYLFGQLVMYTKHKEYTADFI